MKKEIEIKITLSPTLLTKLKTWLKKNAEYKGKVHQVEHYLNNPEKSFHYQHKQGYKDAKEYLRVRFTEKGHTVNLKRFDINEETGASKNIGEAETEVKNGKAMLEILENLGFTESIIIDKTRDKYSYKKFEIEIDKVKGLGTFVEVELLQDVEDIKEGWKIIKEFLKSIEITKFKEQQRGFVSMLWNPEIDFGKEVNLY